jgi:hypothetical protein
MEEEKSIDTMSDSELAAALNSDVEKLDGKVAPEPAKEAEVTPEPVIEEAQAEPVASEEGEADVDSEGNP